jgi:hypothetical protein
MEIKKIRLDVPVIEAVKLTEENAHEVAEWAGGIVKEYGGGKIKVVLPLHGSDSGGENFYQGSWLLKNPHNPGHISYLGEDELFKSVYTEVESVSMSEIAEIIETTMATPSRTARSLSFEAASRVFDRIEQRTGKKIHCIHCETEKGINEMSPRTDGDPSSMCKDCERKRLSDIDEYKARREQLKARGLSEKAIREKLWGN